jgi:hypothetical protein
MGPVFNSEFGMLYIIFLLLLLVAYSCILMYGLTFHATNGSIQDLDHPFLAQAIQGRPLEVQSVVAGSILVIPRNFNKDLIGR